MGSVISTLGSSEVPPSPEADPNNVLVHSFLLDAETDFFSLPICCPGKQAMFHIPQNYSTHLVSFIPAQDTTKMIEEINKILKKTSFPTRKFNPLILSCMLVSFLIIFFGVLSTFTVFVGVILPFVAYFSLMFYMMYTRKEKLLAYLKEWNEKRTDGVLICLGSGETGSATVGTYFANFYIATWDHKSISMKGYLHVFVNYQKRSTWCNQNGVPFIPPVSDEQQIVEQQIATQSFPLPQNRDQAPAGYVLVPQNPQPHSQFLVPPGYVLVPAPQDLPPDFYQQNQSSVNPSGTQVPTGYALVPENLNPPGSSEDLAPPNYEEAIQMKD